MNTPTNSPRRRSWRKILLYFVGLCSAPFAVLLLVALSYAGLERDAALLRRSVMAASGSAWSCKLAINLGPSTVGAVRYGLGWAIGHEIADARLALQAIERASVGIYERPVAARTVDSASLLDAAEHAMSGRGWVRLAGVRNATNTVMVYVPQQTLEKHFDVCLAVCSGSQLVIVSGRLDAAGLAKLLETKIPPELSDRLRRARTQSQSL